MANWTKCRLYAAAERYAAKIATDETTRERHFRSAEAWELLAHQLQRRELGQTTAERLVDGTFFSEYSIRD